jgi:hypothetical protein
MNHLMPMCNISLDKLPPDEPPDENANPCRWGDHRW